MEWVLEIKFGWNWSTLLPWFMIVGTTNAMVGIVMTIIFHAMTAIFAWLFWLRAACPNAQTMRKNWEDGLLYFETAQLGKLSETELIWMYRAFQLQQGLVDIMYSTSRAAYHSFAQQIVLVVAIFSMMRFQDLIFGGDSTGLLLAAISVLGASLSILMMTIESFGIDEVQNRSENFRNAILKGTKRNIAIHKAVRSLKCLTIHSAGSYYNVNKSSYIEWCDQAIDRLVSLLCTI